MANEKDMDDEPVSLELKTDSGVYDANNISGRRKADLILRGELSVDDFVAPANMPGKKLMELRNRHRTGIEAQIKEMTKELVNTFEVGSLVKYKKNITEILATDPERGVQLRTHEGKVKWVHHSKVTAVKENNDDDPTGNA